MFFELFTWTIAYYDPYDEIERVVKQCGRIFRLVPQQAAQRWGTLTGTSFWRFHEHRSRCFQANSAIVVHPRRLQPHTGSVYERCESGAASLEPSPTRVRMTEGSDSEIR